MTREYTQLLYERNVLEQNDLFLAAIISWVRFERIASPRFYVYINRPVFNSGF